MNKIKDYIKTLLKLAMQNNPEVLNVVRNAKVENDKWITVHPRGKRLRGYAKTMGYFFTRSAALVFCK